MKREPFYRYTHQYRLLIQWNWFGFGRKLHFPLYFWNAVNAEKMQKTRKITIFIIFPLCQNLIQLELKILTILILILDITCYYVEIRSFNYITHFRKRIMWKIKSRKIAKNCEKIAKNCEKLLILMSFSFDDTVDVVYTWKYAGIHYRKTNKSKKLIFGM